MTREEAIEVLQQDIPCEHDTDLIEALDMAIKALEQKPTKEEQALLQKWRDNRGISIEDFEEAMNALQEPKTGHWIPTYGNVKCSVCGSVKESRRVGKATHYCDFCGAKMESEEAE